MSNSGRSRGSIAEQTVIRVRINLAQHTYLCKLLQLFSRQSLDCAGVYFGHDMSVRALTTVVTRTRHECEGPNYCSDTDAFNHSVQDEGQLFCFQHSNVKLQLSTIVY